ncbi:MAG: glycerol-3-phosphate 1-O-acyltransferase PlsY [Candidatus Eisenbacteria bacterium]|uniref:Glycerol-3-phosphate acyltransferase n=1 Tax=Eiseniibacteriota bacterium TaxID=2212470 RepID=A0A849SK99_UNCEI|nr:glycerol-3-phosphate 1-O-acyltransferase PlsY [Candidatus Eisenbacteria bacterium]
MRLALILLVGYLCGALPWGLWLGRWFKGVDIRRVGSGNPGATNVYRTLGPAVGVATLILDVLKGSIPVWFAPSLLLSQPDPMILELGRIAAGVGAVLGHVFTFLAGFKGGKGVATTVGVLLALSPPAFAIFVTVFVATVAITRYVSLGSTFGALAFAVALWRFSPRGVQSPAFVLGLVLAALIVWRHRDNYARLARGEERKFSLTGGKRA